MEPLPEIVAGPWVAEDSLVMRATWRVLENKDSSGFTVVLVVTFWPSEKTPHRMTACCRVWNAVFAVPCAVSKLLRSSREAKRMCIVQINPFMQKRPPSGEWHHCHITLDPEAPDPTVYAETQIEATLSLLEKYDAE